MAKSDKRVKVTLECTECKRRNYITMKSKINDRERLEMKKYCSNERQHTLHKETRWRVIAEEPGQRVRSLVDAVTLMGSAGTLAHPNWGQ